MRYPLIGPDDPPPYSFHNPEGSANVLVVCDHASRAFPKGMDQLGLADWVLERHVAWDIGSDTLGRVLADRLNAPAILAGYSRLIVDLNRQLDDPTAFIKVSDGIAIPGNLELTDFERERRIKSFFEPYHNAVTAKLTEFRERGITPALLSIHSCTPVFDRYVRRWHIGVLWDKDHRIARPMLERLVKLDDICVGDNEPYSGRHPHDFTIDFHAEPAGIPHVGIEIRQDLIDTDEGAEKWAGILADVLEPILADEALYTVFEESYDRSDLADRNRG